MRKDHQGVLVPMTGFGINVVLSGPLLYMADPIRRRSSKSINFTLLAILCIAATFLASSTWIVALTGSYLFGIAYSLREGPAPFYYAAESMPLYIRDQGMSLVVSINWLFSCLLVVTLQKVFVALNLEKILQLLICLSIISWLMVYFLVPETQNLSLEQLDLVFGRHSPRQSAAEAIEKASYRVKIILARTPILRGFALQEKDLVRPGSLSTSSWPQQAASESGLEPLTNANDAPPVVVTARNGDTKQPNQISSDSERGGETLPDTIVGKIFGYARFCRRRLRDIPRPPLRDGWIRVEWTCVCYLT